MMGHTHALAGAAAWLGTAPFLADYGLRMTPGEIAAGTVVCAGAALLPDLDHHDGTIANTFGPVSKLLCRGVSAISGGHRHATHSLFFCVLMAIGADLLAKYVHWGWYVMLFLLVGLGLRGIGIRIADKEHFSAILNVLIAGALTFIMIGMQFAGPGLGSGVYRLNWAGLAVGLGCVMHVVTDCITPEGCPVFWPFKHRIGIPLVPRTNGTVEMWVVTPLLTLGILILAMRSSIGSFTAHWLERNGG